MLSSAEGSERSFEGDKKPLPEVIIIKDEDDKIIIKPEEGDPQFTRLRRRIRLLQEERDTVKKMLKLVAKQGNRVREHVRLLQDDRKILGELIDISNQLGDDGLQMEFLAEKRRNIQEERQLVG